MSAQRNAAGSPRSGRRNTATNIVIPPELLAGGGGGGSTPTSTPAPARSPSVAIEQSTEENIKVLCRVRPFNNREIEIHSKSVEGKPTWEQYPIRSVVEFSGGQCAFLDAEHDWIEKEKFGFDSCFWSIPETIQGSENPFATQETVFNIYGKEVLEQAWKGYNTCFFAYGQTGSGKTHSMMGTLEDTDEYPADPGLTPRLCKQLFEDVDAHIQESEANKANFIKNFRISVQYLEIYNEMVKDLLWQLSELPADLKAKTNHENLKIRQTPSTGTFVEHLTSIRVSSWEEMIGLIELGNSTRTTAATKMNERSSRSHAIFKITLSQITTTVPKRQFDKPAEHIREACINLVDLAGSERNKKTGATGDRLKEAANINKSLSCLKGVIDALVENCTSKGPKKRIPYRDSHLTSILADSIGGNSKTYMLVTLSPHRDNAEETLNTLKYGSKARQIISTAHVNENAAGRLMLDLEEEIKRMKEKKLRMAEEEEGADLEEAEEIQAQIDRTEAIMREKLLEIRENDARAISLQEETQKAAKNRHLVGLAKWSHLTQAHSRTSQAVNKEVDIRQQIGELIAAKNEIETKKQELILDLDEAQEECDNNKSIQQETEYDIEQFQKKTAKLETQKWDEQKKLDDLTASWKRIRKGRIDLLMKSHLEIAKMKVAARRRGKDRDEEHKEQHRLLVEKLRKQNDDIRSDNDIQSALAEKELEDKRKDLHNLKSVLDRAEGERHRQIESLEATISHHQSENKRRKEAMSHRVGAMTNSWEKRYSNMVISMEKQYRELVDECNKKHRVEEEREEKALETIRRKHAEEVKGREKEWKQRISLSITKGKKDYSESEARWEKQLEERRSAMEDLRVKLREVDGKERQYAAFQRRVASVLQTSERPTKGSSANYKKLYDLLELFHGEYEEKHPSRALLENLLNNDVNKRRCADPPTIGLGVVETEEEAEDHGRITVGRMSRSNSFSTSRQQQSNNNAAGSAETSPAPLRHRMSMSGRGGRFSGFQSPTRNGSESPEATGLRKRQSIAFGLSREGSVDHRASSAQPETPRTPVTDTPARNAPFGARPSSANSRTTPARSALFFSARIRARTPVMSSMKPKAT